MKDEIQVNIRLPGNIVEQIDKMVDGAIYRSRAQLVTVALYDWLTKQGAEMYAHDWMCLPKQEGDFDLTTDETQQELYEMLQWFKSVKLSGKASELAVGKQTKTRVKARKKK